MTDIELVRKLLDSYGTKYKIQDNQVIIYVAMSHISDVRKELFVSHPLPDDPDQKALFLKFNMPYGDEGFLYDIKRESLLK